MPELVALITGKPHISFSELRDWKECSYRHKLKFVEHIVFDKPGIHMDFGTAIHSACEMFLKTRVMDINVFTDKFTELWGQHSQIDPLHFTETAFKSFTNEGLRILADIPSWFDKQFPGWVFVDAEHALYESIENHTCAFKGFIDCIITAPGPRNKTLIWLLDFKTCGWGWSTEKKSDDLVRAQLVLYKNFWAIKTKTDPKDVRCGFVLLKRTAKPGNCCELITTSVGEVTTNRSLKVVNNMITSISRGIAIKNRSSCMFCDYKGTSHCT